MTDTKHSTAHSAEYLESMTKALHALTRKDLIERCKQLEVKNYARLRKPELVKNILTSIMLADSVHNMAPPPVIGYNNGLAEVSKYLGTDFLSIIEEYLEPADINDYPDSWNSIWAVEDGKFVNTALGKKLTDVNERMNSFLAKGEIILRLHTMRTYGGALFWSGKFVAWQWRPVGSWMADLPIDGDKYVIFEEPIENVSKIYFDVEHPIIVCTDGQAQSHQLRFNTVGLSKQAINLQAKYVHFSTIQSAVNEEKGIKEIYFTNAAGLVITNCNRTYTWGCPQYGGHPYTGNHYGEPLKVHTGLDSFLVEYKQNMIHHSTTNPLSEASQYHISTGVKKIYNTSNSWLIWCEDGTYIATGEGAESKIPAEIENLLNSEGCIEIVGCPSTFVVLTNDHKIRQWGADIEIWSDNLYYTSIYTIYYYTTLHAVGAIGADGIQYMFGIEMSQSRP